MTISTSSEFEACLPFVLKEEGGYSNTPGDHGGATNFGIIQKEYNIYRHGKGLSLQSVHAISPDEYREIYWQSYWMPHCQELPPGLNLSVFNINVNGGPGRGTKLLQQCLAITVDGVWGALTSSAVETLVAAGNVAKVIADFHDDERAFYQAIINHDPSQRKFAKDWFGRNDRCERASLAMWNATAGMPASS
jgi:lysozyme family protein